jgi:hypothetical protein
VGAYLKDAQLATEYRTLLGIARARKIPTLERHIEDAALFPGNVENLDKRRGAYMTLLQTLQAGFIEGRFRRRLLQETALQMFWIGLVAMALALAPFVFFAISDRDIFKVASGTAGHLLFSHEPGPSLVIAAGFGLLGAYFSRLLSFQSKLTTLDFDDVMTLYKPRPLYVRLLYGAIGAIVFYLILRSELVGGTAFPNFKILSMGDKAGAPTLELAKLLVWSFLAGFSERLLPDSLERVEGKASAPTK